MLARIQECILYRNFSNGEILNDMTELINLMNLMKKLSRQKKTSFSKVSTGWWNWQECMDFPEISGIHILHSFW